MEWVVNIIFVRLAEELRYFGAGFTARQLFSSARAIEFNFPRYKFTAIKVEMSITPFLFFEHAPITLPVTHSPIIIISKTANYRARIETCVNQEQPRQADNIWPGRVRLLGLWATQGLRFGPELCQRKKSRRWNS